MVPGRRAAGGDLAGDRVHQHRLDQPRGERRAPAHEHAVVVLAAERGAGERDEGDLHVGWRARAFANAFSSEPSRVTGGMPR
jgi:hypothetical protein